MNDWLVTAGFAVVFVTLIGAILIAFFGDKDEPL